MVIKMTLCRNCSTIQKLGSKCTVCGAPVQYLFSDTENNESCDDRCLDNSKCPICDEDFKKGSK